jgi:hypothetical protein
MWQDIEAMYAGHIDQVCADPFSRESRLSSSVFSIVSGSGAAL